MKKIIITFLSLALVCLLIIACSIQCNRVSAGVEHSNDCSWKQKVEVQCTIGDSGTKSYMVGLLPDDLAHFHIDYPNWFKINGLENNIGLLIKSLNNTHPIIHSTSIEISNIDLSHSIGFEIREDLNLEKLNNLKYFIQNDMPDDGEYKAEFSMNYQELAILYCTESYYEPFSFNFNYSPNGTDNYEFSIEANLPDMLFGYYNDAILDVPEEAFKNSSFRQILLNSLKHCKNEFKNGHPGKSWHLIEEQILKHIKNDNNSWIVDDFERQNLYSIFLKNQNIFEVLQSCNGW